MIHNILPTVISLEQAICNNIPPLCQSSLLLTTFPCSIIVPCLIVPILSPFRDENLPNYLCQRKWIWLNESFISSNHRYLGLHWSLVSIGRPLRRGRPKSFENLFERAQPSGCPHKDPWWHRYHSLPRQWQRTWPLACPSWCADSESVTRKVWRSPEEGVRPDIWHNKRNIMSVRVQCF